MSDEPIPEEGRPTTHQERVAAEHDALKGNVERLHNFINGAAFESVGPEEQHLLKMQYGAMQSYLNALTARVKLHKDQA